MVCGPKRLPHMDASYNVYNVLNFRILTISTVNMSNCPLYKGAYMNTSFRTHPPDGGRSKIKSGGSSIRGIEVTLLTCPIPSKIRDAVRVLVRRLGFHSLHFGHDVLS